MAEITFTGVHLKTDPVPAEFGEQGFKARSYAEILADSMLSTAMATKFYAVRVGVPAGMPVNSITVHALGSASATGDALFIVYDDDGNEIARTANDPNLFKTNGLATINLATPIPASDEVRYVWVLHTYPLSNSNLSGRHMNSMVANNPSQYWSASSPSGVTTPPTVFDPSGWAHQGFVPWVALS
ncbi:hypothetical protein [Sphaerisporangium sp. NPDC051011]|uniref:hypothetical protein n=1 Tax=Sphaerisporangium sp. NPDC051011 TaxID=3155792 RepID=UPI0033F954E6